MSKVALLKFKEDADDMVWIIAHNPMYDAPIEDYKKSLNCEVIYIDNEDGSSKEN